MKILTGIGIGIASLLMLSCKTAKTSQLSSTVKTMSPMDSLLQTTDLAGAHVGIAVYDPTAKFYLYQHQSDKYFIPASNTKILSCYVAMKYLGDSLVGLRYVDKGNGTVEIEPSGDPSFLHPDFPNQPVYEFLKKQKNILLTNQNWKAKGWGMGWSWDDYESDYMAQRSVMPIYGNLVQFTKVAKPTATPAYFQQLLKIDPTINGANYAVRREVGANHFFAIPAKTAFAGDDIPFYTDDQEILSQLLRDTLKTVVKISKKFIL
jgi:D-alanyl-D-alanine carboxypeptidase/D-alanyl-D-alanine-endopeptidase (penicillin-binding protein 4)